MDKKYTVLILGAGASFEAGLPTGLKLTKIISKLLEVSSGRYQSISDSLISSAINTHIQSSGANIHLNQEYTMACSQISRGMLQAPSIDNYIDVHKNNEKIVFCGKLAIVRSILNAEQNSKLYVDPSNSYNRLKFRAIDSTWYYYLNQLIVENCEIENLVDKLKSISFIIFNYDRCVEHYLYCSFQNYYGISKAQAAEIVNSIEIYHPYGVVGSLPWKSNQNAIEFGADPNQAELVHLSGQINTFTESTNLESSNTEQIQSLINKADNIVFLGFAFRKLNMQLINPVIEQSDKIRRIFATAHEISNSDCQLIKNMLITQYCSHESYVELRNDLTCSSLFTEYSRSLSLM